MDQKLLALKNGIYSLFSDNIVCIQTWGIYLFDKKFNDEPELRNKVGVVWLSSLFDSLESEVSALEDYKRLAVSLNQSSLFDLCETASAFIDTIKELLSMYSREEQLFILDIRDQLVHSWLPKRHREKRIIKYFNGKEFKKEEVSKDKYDKDIRRFYKHPKGLDFCLQGIIIRFTSNKHKYWSAVKQLSEQMPVIHDIIYNDKKIDIKVKRKAYKPYFNIRIKIIQNLYSLIDLLSNT